VIQHKADRLSKGADALSRRHLLLVVLGSKVFGFEVVKGLYAQDEDFKEVFEKSTQHAHGLFHVQDRFLF